MFFLVVWFDQIVYSPKLTPDEEIEQKTNTKDDKRVENGSVESGFFPEHATQGLVQTSAVVAGHKTHEHIEEETRCD